MSTPKQNGIADQKNDHLLEIARSLIFTMNVPKSLWENVVLIVSYLINRLPSPVLQFKSPIEFLSRIYFIPSISSIPYKIFGCVCFVHDYRSSGEKLDPEALWCVFIGCSSLQ